MEPIPKHRELLPNKLGHPRFPNKLGHPVGHPVGHPRFPNKLGHPVGHPRFPNKLGHPVMKGRRASLPKDWRVFEKALLRACDAGR